jgi:hypothetical protein
MAKLMSKSELGTPRCRGAACGACCERLAMREVRRQRLVPEDDAGTQATPSFLAA